MKTSAKHFGLAVRPYTR